MSNFFPADGLSRRPLVTSESGTAGELSRSLGSNVGAPLSRFPTMVAVETVGMCNAACGFCPHPSSGKNEAGESMPDRLLYKILEECSNEDDLEVFNLSFQNEPLMDPDIFMKVALARKLLKRSVKLTMVTNGSLLRGRRLRNLMESPPDVLKISMTGITAESYEKAMKNLRFHVTLSNVERLIKMAATLGRPHIIINCVMTQEMEQVGVRRLREFWAERGAELHVMNLENRAGALTADQQALSSGSWNARVWCKRPEEQLSIWPNGDVALCCADWTKEVILGNVNRESLKEIWWGPSIGRYRDVLRRGCGDELSPCSNCTAAEIAFEGRQYREAGKLAEAL